MSIPKWRNHCNGGNYKYNQWFHKAL